MRTMQPFDDGPDAEIRYTDLKGAIELTPTQLATMQGDSETRLPSNRTRVFEQPASWQKWTSKSENTQNVGTTGASQQPARTITQATFILQTTNASKNSASMAATQTDALIQSYIAENGRPNHSPEIEFLDGLMDLSRNCAAPLIAYYALKENTHGKQTNSRI